LDKDLAPEMVPDDTFYSNSAHDREPIWQLELWLMKNSLRTGLLKLTRLRS